MINIYMYILKRKLSLTHTNKQQQTKGEIVLCVCVELIFNNYSPKAKLILLNNPLDFFNNIN